jgi:hypothetical protein
VHVLEALRAAKPEIVALLRWRALYARRQREHIRSFRGQPAGGHRDGLRRRVANLKAVTRGKKRLRQFARVEAYGHA